MNTDDIECPKCKTTKYRNPQLKLLVNVCGHSLCEKCIDAEFVTGTAKCFQCPTPLKRGGFKQQLFQDSSVSKDLLIRRDILKKHSKNEDAFPDLRSYNDYLEKLETIIYNLSNGIDLDETNKLLDELRRPTSETIIVKQQVKELPYFHKSESLLSEGPSLPVIDERFLNAMKKLATQDLAGGFTAELAINRALGEAFTNLFSRPCRAAS